MRDQKFIKVFLSAFFAILLFVGVGSYVIDPFGLHFSSRTEGFNRHKPKYTKYERVTKLFNADAIDPDAIFLGNSRICYLAPEEAFTQYEPHRYYNFSLSSGMVHEMDELTAYAIRNYDIEFICYGIDFIALCDYGGKYAETFDVELVRGEKPKLLEFIKLHTSVQAIEESYECVQANYRSPDGLEIGAQINASGSRTHEWRELAYSLWGEDWIESEKDKVLETYKPIYNNSNLHLPKAKKDAYNSIRDQCRENGISFMAYINPIYKDQFNLLTGSKAYPKYIEFVRFLAENGGIWYFGGDNAITSDMEYYWDSQHPRKNLSPLIAEAIFSGTPGVYTNRLFGQYYDADNIDILVTELDNYREALLGEE